MSSVSAYQLNSFPSITGAYSVSGNFSHLPLLFFGNTVITLPPSLKNRLLLTNNDPQLRQISPLPQPLPILPQTP